jgi:predicted HTH domain antitoxin
VAIAPFLTWIFLTHFLPGSIIQSCVAQKYRVNQLRGIFRDPAGGKKAMLPLVMEIPEESILALKVSPDQIGQTLRLAAAIKLYEIGRLSSGAAARLAGVPRVIFLSRLSEYGVDTFNLTEKDLNAEKRLA